MQTKEVNNNEEMKVRLLAAFRKEKKERIESGHKFTKRDQYTWFTGAFAALQAVFGTDDKLASEIPVAWVIQLLSGRIPE